MWPTLQDVLTKSCFSPDTAYSCDPRIKKFKEEEKARKESEKKAKVEAKKREQDEKDRVGVALIPPSVW